MILWRGNYLRRGKNEEITIAFYQNNFVYAGPGETVQIAKEMAASDALWRLFGTAEHQLNIRFDVVVDPSAISIPNVSVDEWSEKKIQERLRAKR